MVIQTEQCSRSRAQSQESSVIKQIFAEADIPLENHQYADGDAMPISRLYPLAHSQTYPCACKRTHTSLTHMHARTCQHASGTHAHAYSKHTCPRTHTPAGAFHRAEFVEALVRVGKYKWRDIAVADSMDNLMQVPPHG